MRIPLLLLAAAMILAGDVLILLAARTIPHTVFAGRAEWICAGILLIAAGVTFVLYANLRLGR